MRTIAPYVNRRLDESYSPAPADIQCVISMAVKAGLLMNVGLGDTTLTVSVQHCPPPWLGEDVEWTNAYQGDPAGRCVVSVSVSGARFRASVHARGIYQDHPNEVRAPRPVAGLERAG